MIEKFIIGTVCLFIGALFGVMIMALLCGARERRNPQPENHNEHTKLLTIGSLVKWRGNVYEITGFRTYDDDNLTYATISYKRWSADVPVEELEEVGNSD